MALSLHDHAARLGGFCWTERRLFEVLGGAAARSGDPAAKVLLDRHASHAAWRAEQWWARLPVLAVIDRDELVVAPTPATAAVYDLLAGDLPGAAGSIGRLSGLYRVALPRLAGAYRAHWARTTEVADGPARRTLTQVEADLQADRAEGEPFVHTFLTSSEAVDEAAAIVAALERLLV
jgi:hypothetical protein